MSRVIPGFIDAMVSEVDTGAAIEASPIAPELPVEDGSRPNVEWVKPFQELGFKQHSCNISIKVWLLRYDTRRQKKKLSSPLTLIVRGE